MKKLASFPGNDDAIRAVGLLTRVIADAVAEGLIARAGLKTSEAASIGSDEPLADWERELLEGDKAEAPAAEAPVAVAAVADMPAAEVTEAVVTEAAPEGKSYEGAVAANEDGSAPNDFTIKGNAQSMKRREKRNGEHHRCRR